MGSQPLSDKNARKVGRAIDVELVRVVAHGGTHVLSIVSADHRHGWYDPRSGEHGWYVGDVAHFTSCDEFFPGHAR